MRGLALIAFIASISLVAASGGESAVRRVSLTSPIRAGGYASITVNVTPRARCTISAIYNGKTGTNVLSAAGLEPKTGGRITWRWRMPSDARPTGDAGTPMKISCGSSGTLQAQLVVGPIPEFPRILSARLVDGTPYGKAVRVAYCFRSLPRDPWRRPSRLHLTVENLRDNLPPLSVGWQVAKRCDTITHPVGPIEPPYLLRYSVETVRGTLWRAGQLRL